MISVFRYFAAPVNREQLHLYNITHSHYDEIDIDVTVRNDNMVPPPLEDTDKDSEDSYQLTHVYIEVISPNAQEQFNTHIVPEI